MPTQLRPYQETAVNVGCEFFRGANPEDNLLLASPTGTGKTYIQLAIWKLFADCWIITPRVEIIYGMLNKLGIATDDADTDAMDQLAYDLRITTPIKLRNRLLAGAMRTPPGRLIIDEAHHDTAKTYAQIRLMLDAPALGMTATPYRGTPKSTAEFLALWGEPEWIITYPQAHAMGYL